MGKRNGSTMTHLREMWYRYFGSRGLWWVTTLRSPGCPEDICPGLGAFSISSYYNKGPKGNTLISPMLH